MLFVLFVLLLLTLGGLLGLSNVATLIASANNAGNLAILQTLLVFLGSVMLLLAAYGYAKKRKWRKNIAFMGVVLTFVSGLLSLLGAPVWLTQLGLPVIILAVLFIEN